jgi:hypothetical protein
MAFFTGDFCFTGDFFAVALFADTLLAATGFVAGAARRVAGMSDDLS